MFKNHYTEYKYYSSHDLIGKTNRWCSGLYLSSKKFAEETGNEECIKTLSELEKRDKSCSFNDS